MQNRTSFAARAAGLVAVGVLMATGAAAHADIIAFWSFPAVVPATGSNFVVMPVAANVNNRAGIAQITTDALSSAAFNINGDVQYFTGSTVNAPSGVVAGSGLNLRGGTGSQSNGKSFIFRFDATNAENLVMSYAERYTSSGSPTAVAVSYSTNGADFTAVPSLGYMPLRNSDFLVSARVLDFSTFTTLNNAPAAYVKLTFTGYTNSTGSVRLDNVTVVPAPVAMALAALGGIISVRRRRHAA